MAVKTHYSVLPLSLVFLYSIVDFVFSLIFLFRDVILCHGGFVFVFFPRIVRWRSCRKAWCCMWKRDFWHSRQGCVSSLGGFSSLWWNMSYVMKIWACVWVCVGQVCLTKVRVLIVLHSPLLYCSRRATKAILWPLLFVLPVVSQLQARNSFQSLSTGPVWSSRIVDKSCGRNFRQNFIYLEENESSFVVFWLASGNLVKLRSSFTKCFEGENLSHTNLMHTNPWLKTTTTMCCNSYSSTLHNLEANKLRS